MKKYGVGCSALALALMVASVSPAQAQEAGTVGLVMMSGTSVGVSIHASDSVAVRPSAAFARLTSDNGGLADGKRTATGWAPGINVLCYVKSWDATRLYVSPQWTYSHTTSSDDGANEAKATGHLLAAMLGAQHNLGGRFAVFGEVGLGRETSKNTGLGGAIGTKATTWSTRSTVGGILFF